MGVNQRTTHNVDVLGARVVAQIVDGILMFIIALALVIGGVGIGSAVTSGASESAGGGVVLVFYLLAFAVVFFYNAGLEYYWNGQTVGKRLMGIKVVSESGEKAGFGQTIVRNIPAVFNLGIFSALAALLSIAMSDKKQRIFDVFASTIVIEEGSGAQPEHEADTGWSSDAEQSTQF